MSQQFFSKLLLLSALYLHSNSASALNSSNETISVDTAGETTAFPHKWEEMFGSGRAILSLRENYRNDLRTTKTVADIKYVRFHNIFHDEVGAYDEDKDGKPIYNWTLVDQIYDGLLQNGVRPFVELGFMPSKLAASPPVIQSFWYKPNVTPPKDWRRSEKRTNRRKLTSSQHSRNMPSTQTDPD